MKPGNKVFQEIPLEIAGGSKFGRYPKISSEMTVNMIVSDGWMVPFAGYDIAINITNTGQGRGIFASDSLGLMFFVINNFVYSTNADLVPTIIGHLNSYTGDVFIQANNNGQVAFSDPSGGSIWIYTPRTGDFSQAVTTGVSPAGLNFQPGYIGFQDTYFISPDTGSNFWYLSTTGNGLVWLNDAQHQGSIQTKPDTAQAAVRVPSKGNQLFVFGKTVTESWRDQGYQLFPYQRDTNINLDYGCANPDSIAYLDNYVVWLGKNEQAGYAIMVSDGGSTTQLSTDGINYLIATLTQPENVYGFIFKQDGHVLYVITWPADNLSYVYDFETKLFSNLTDPAGNCHIAKRVCFFNGLYYFISLVDGNIYELSSSIYTANGLELPRIRVCKNIRLPDQSRFVLATLGFTIEQGTTPFTPPNNIPRIDLTLSKDGGINYGSAFPKPLNPLGNYANRLWWLQLGEGNDITPLLRFWGMSKFLATNGVASIYQ